MDKSVTVIATDGLAAGRYAGLSSVPGDGSARWC